MRKVEIGWRTENEEGIKMEMVAIREKSKYSYKYCLKGEDEWTFVDKVSLEHLQELREILNMRYRRRRGSYKEVEFLDKMIKGLG